MGLANAVPVIFRSAGEGHDPGAAIAAVSTIGYLGFLAGPPMIGLLSEALGLSHSLLVVVAFGLMVALGARIVVERRDSAPTSSRPEHDRAVRRSAVLAS
jgi:MFS family permease